MDGTKSYDYRILIDIPTVASFLAEGGGGLFFIHRWMGGVGAEGGAQVQALGDLFDAECRLAAEARAAAGTVGSGIVLL